MSEGKETRAELNVRAWSKEVHDLTERATNATARIITLQGERDTLATQLRSTEAALREERDRVKGLEAEAYVPGFWQCAKCKLPLWTTAFSVADGSMSADNSPQQCPNNCGPMWRVTERAERKDAQKMAGEWHDRMLTAEAKLAAMAAALEGAGLRMSAEGHVEVSDWKAVMDEIVEPLPSALQVPR